jgi:hypothetical protein
MKNPRIALALIAALGLVAALLWRTGQTPPHDPQPPATPGQDAAPLPPVVAPPIAPIEPKPIHETAPAPFDAPEAPTATGARVPEGTAVYARGIADGPRVVQLAIDKAGGVRGLDNLRRATYELFRVGGHSSVALEALCDEKGNVLVTDKQTGEESGLVDGTCWIKRGSVVLPCDPDARALLMATGLAHVSTALVPLQGPPWQLKSAGATTLDGRLTDTLLYSAPHVPETALFVNPVSGRVERLAALNVRVELSEPQTFGFAQLPTTRRITLFDDDMQQNRVIEFADRVASIKPSAELTRMKPPAVTKLQPVQVVARPQLTAVKVDSGTHAGMQAGLDTLRGVFSWEETAKAEVYEVLGAAPTLDQGVQLWIAVPPYAGAGNEGLRQRLTVVPAEPAVASQVMRIPADQLLTAVQKFLGEQKNASGRPVVRYLTPPDPQAHEVTVELQVPVQK